MDISKLKSAITQEGFLRYFRNTSWLVGEKILRIFAGIVVGAMVARYLGPSKYGLFNYAISFVGVFISLATLGLDSIVVRELIKLEKRKEEILGSAFVMRFLGSFVVLTLLYLSVLLTDNTELESTLILIIGASTIFHCFNTIDFYFQSKVLSKYIVFSSIAAMLVSSIMKLFLIYFEASLVYFAIVVIFESITLSLFLFYFYRKQGNRMKSWKFSWDVSKYLLKDSWPLILSGVVVSMYLKIDQVMIKHMVDDYAVGIYAAAARLSETWYFIPIVITNSLFPAIVNAKKRNDGSYQLRVQRLFDFMVIISLAIAIPVTFLSQFLIEVLYGEDFLAAATILIIQMWTGIFVALGVASSAWLISENLQKIYLLGSIIGACINIALNYIFIPTYGVIGAAFTTMFSQVVSILFLELLFKKTRGVLMMKWKSVFVVSIVSFIVKKVNK